MNVTNQWPWVVGQDEVVWVQSGATLETGWAERVVVVSTEQIGKRVRWSVSLAITVSTGGATEPDSAFAFIDQSIEMANAAGNHEIRLQLARDLHDGVAQSLTTMLVELEDFKRDQAGRQSVLREVASLQRSTREVLDSLRQLLLDLRGNPALSEDLADTLESGLLVRFRERTGVDVRLTVKQPWPKVLTGRLAMNMYRIIQEALNNAWFHGRATNVKVSLTVAREGQLCVEVVDNGVGFSEMAGNGMGLGLLGMRERAAILGGCLSVESAPGMGTTVQALFPLDSET